MVNTEDERTRIWSINWQMYFCLMNDNLEFNKIAFVEKVTREHLSQPITWQI